jgi:diguanylate cyclase (GGDEF)-like protein
VTDSGDVPGDGFRHEALLHAGDSGFLAGALPFIRAALSGGEPIYVVVGARKLGLLRSALGVAAGDVQFADMAQVGHNPARLNPAWREFLDLNAAGGRRVRGVGELITATQGTAELVECQRHEALLNVAFAGTAPSWLLCSYDTETLNRSVVKEATRSHPYLLEEGVHRVSRGFRAERMATSHLDEPLPEPVGRYGELSFGAAELRSVHAMVTGLAAWVGMDPHRTDDLVVAVNEIAINSLRHADGRGTFRLWRDEKSLVCEVRDSGRIEEPLAGRIAPGTDGDFRRGLWVANQLCDLVQIRTFPTGSVVRLHLALFGKAEMRLKHITLHDQLTGLANRTMLRDRLNHALVLGARDQRRHAVLFCDLDAFKAVNDTYGHAVGDQVLIGVAGRLRDSVRPGDTIARIGGDEFVVLCEGVATAAGADMFVERITGSLAAPVLTSAGPVSISLSIGVAMSEPGQSADDLMADADAAMYRVKRPGQARTPLTLT